MQQPALAIGDRAPDFTLPSTSGESVHLFKQLQHSAVVLFFYVAAFTPVCTAEVCSFRDNSERFTDVNAAIYGIGFGPETVTRSFANYHRLPYPLLLDRGNRVRKLYGVPKSFGLLPGRSTFVVGQDQKILHVTQAGFDSHPHVLESLDILRRGSPA